LQWRNSLCVVLSSCACSIVCLVCYGAAIVKLRRTTRRCMNRSTAMVKAERSLSFLTFTNCICMLTLASTNLCFLLYYDVNLVFTFRSFQIDLLLFLPIWVLYFTHPAFKKSITNSTSVNVMASDFQSSKRKSVNPSSVVIQ
ncbi:hypothetical protein OSTOST_04531, partial [Ostertagia ostertagi]